MAGSPYNLRSRFKHQNGTLKITPSNSPLIRQAPRLQQRSEFPTSTLSLNVIIGTTTVSPSGFACHSDSNRFALCAGSAIVLAEVDTDGGVSQRFFRARPTAGAINPISSFYDQTTPVGTPQGRRKSMLPARSSVFGVDAGGSPCREWPEERSAKTWTARERVKAVSCLDLSADGQFIAAGETGYNPRVLIFSSEGEMGDIPVSIMTEHSFGVRAVAFSPNMRFLATLGDPNDGFLFVWSFNQKTGAVRLHSTNKCTANILDMMWCGTSLITVGTRHVKIWRPISAAPTSPTKTLSRRFGSESQASPAPHALVGRNFLLGCLADATFTCVTAISDQEALVCADSGHICLLRSTETSQELKIVRKLEFDINAIAVRPQLGSIAVLSSDSHLEFEDIATLLSTETPARLGTTSPWAPGSARTSPRLFSPADSPARTGKHRKCHTAALGWLSRGLVRLNSNCKVQICLEPDERPLHWKEPFGSHYDPVQGVSLLPSESTSGAFCTWSQSGVIHVWSASGELLSSHTINLEQIRDGFGDFQNELRIVCPSKDADRFVIGDKLGVIKLMDIAESTTVCEMRAHGSEVTGICMNDEPGLTLVATCGRDRVVQLFANRPESSMELVQTMDDHVGAVAQVIFGNQGKRLLSSSADRTIIIRERITRQKNESTAIAFLSQRIVTLKASPVSMAIVPDDTESLTVSTMDRQVVKVNMSSGLVVDSFKTVESESEDTVVMNSLLLSKMESSKSPRLLLGYSSTDKSIRVYDYDQGTLLTRESGHTEGVSGLALLEDEDAITGKIRRNVISTGLDGIIMIWDLSISPPLSLTIPLQELSQGQAIPSDHRGHRDSLAALLPLRKVLSKTDLAEFSFFDPVTQTSTPVRDQSPPRVRRKPSRHSLSPTKLFHTDVAPHLPPTKCSAAGTDPCATRETSPSLPTILPLPANLNPRTRSPSPARVAASLPTTPRAHPTNRANNARLRRPPSVPSDLRSHAISASRRKTMAPPREVELPPPSTTTHDLTTRLREYRAAEHSVCVDLLAELERELLATLEHIREKWSGGRKKAASDGVGDEGMDVLADMVARTAVSTQGGDDGF